MLLINKDIPRTPLTALENDSEFRAKTFEPISVKTGLNDIEKKIQITALRESITFSECFLKI